MILPLIGAVDPAHRRAEKLIACITLSGIAVTAIGAFALLQGYLPFIGSVNPLLAKTILVIGHVFAITPTILSITKIIYPIVPGYVFTPIEDDASDVSSVSNEVPDIAQAAAARKMLDATMQTDPLINSGTGVAIQIPLETERPASDPNPPSFGHNLSATPAGIPGLPSSCLSRTRNLPSLHLACAATDKTTREDDTEERMPNGKLSSLTDSLERGGSAEALPDPPTPQMDHNPSAIPQEAPAPPSSAREDHTEERPPNGEHSPSIDSLDTGDSSTSSAAGSSLANSSPIPEESDSATERSPAQQSSYSIGQLLSFFLNADNLMQEIKRKRLEKGPIQEFSYADNPDNRWPEDKKENLQNILYSTVEFLLNQPSIKQLLQLEKSRVLVAQRIEMGAQLLGIHPLTQLQYMQTTLYPDGHSLLYKLVKADNKSTKLHLHCLIITLAAYQQDILQHLEKFATDIHKSKRLEKLRKHASQKNWKKFLTHCCTEKE